MDRSSDPDQAQGTSAPPRRRGAYAKTAARQREILDAAVDVFAHQGFRGSSLRDIADRVGMSQPGLLHHFGTKEGLLTAVLAHRDQQLSDGSTGIEALRASVSAAAAQPGLTRMFITLAAEATDPDHPAHEFFVERYRTAKDTFRTHIARAQRDGYVSAADDPSALAEQLVAVMDGLQLQWLLDDTLDLGAAFDRFLDTLTRTTLTLSQSRSSTARDEPRLQSEAG